MAAARATIHGAISIVNAIATGKGAALGISKKVNVEMETSHGKGVVIGVENKSMSSRLINKVIRKIVSKNELSKTKLKISLDSEVPTGYGLKSSSAISTAVAMVCAKLFKPRMNDFFVIIISYNKSTIVACTRIIICSCQTNFSFNRCIDTSI